MQSSSLIPYFVPSADARELLCFTGVGEKMELYLHAWQWKDYPLSMSKELERRVILHLDVMEALLFATTQRYNSRNDYIRVFFTAAAGLGNLSALQFFLEKGIKLNEVRYGVFDENALDWAIKNGQAEAAMLLLQHGAKPVLKYIRKIA